MADTPNVTLGAQRVIDGLPATWGDVAYEVYVRQAIEMGLTDVIIGVVAHEDAPARIRAS